MKLRPFQTLCSFLYKDVFDASPSPRFNDPTDTSPSPSYQMDNPSAWVSGAMRERINRALQGSGLSPLDPQTPGISTRSGFGRLALAGSLSRVARELVCLSLQKLCGQE